LITGCGTGITAFYLADQGFSNITGTDLLPECISIAQEVNRMGEYGAEFLVDDGLAPKISGTYDLITALHWVFSAWMGNYGNDPADAKRAWTDEYREAALTSFLSAYGPHLRPHGVLMIELTDAVTDYRLAEDHFLGAASASIYPVRHSPEQVEQCAASQGFELVDKQLCVSFGHHPRTLYTLRKGPAS
jgi:cyclopropane fatty-acyl-phospholipid synthase-like methyltransferase